MLRSYKDIFLVFLFLIFLSCENNELEEEIDPCTITNIQVITSTSQQPDYASSNGTIEITATGSEAGMYQFSLNDTLYQNLNQFTNLQAGDYTIFVRDGNNCKANATFTLKENPAITLQSPSDGEEVTAPFDITYQIFNFGEVSSKGNSINFYVDDAYVSAIYDASKHTIAEMPEGIHKMKLVLVENGNELNIADSVNIKVAPSLYTVSIEGGSGDGEYKVGEWVNVVADLPSSGKIFFQWSGNIDILRDSKDPTVSFQMPPQNVSLVSSYQDLSYKSHIKPLIKNKCIACHGKAATDGVDISTYLLQKEFAQDIKRTIEECSMPPQNDCLSADEIHAIVSWIDLGMPNN